MNYKRFLYLWLVIVMFSGGLRAQVYTDHINRAFKVSPKSSVEVFNKYGKVHVVTWDKDSVMFQVDLRISTNNEQKLEKLKNNISFDFTSTNYYVVAKTTFARSRGIITEFVDAFVPSNSVVIDYIVYIPRQATLKIDNKFGDVYIDDFSGNLDLTLSNGELKANYLSGNTSIKLNSGDGVINRVDRGKIYISYSDLMIKQATKIDIESKSSVITVNKGENLRINSRRDKYFFEDLKEISGDTYFTNLKIGNLKNEASLQFKYGGIIIEQIQRNFGLINIHSEYADIDLFFVKGSAYNLDISHHQDVYLKIPSSMAETQTEELNKEDKMMLTYGKIGSNVTVNSPKVKIDATKKCVINIIHK